MPDSMNFANDPSYAAQQGMPMQGWDPNQYPGQMNDPYAQGMYPQDMQSQQAMYGNQMGSYPGYAEQMGQQGMYPDAYAQQGGMYYPNENVMPQQGYDPNMEAENERVARQQQMRASSIFGPKDRAASVPEIDQAAMQQQNQMMGQHAQPMGMGGQQAQMQSNQMQQPQASAAAATASIPAVNPASQQAAAPSMTQSQGRQQAAQAQQAAAQAQAQQAAAQQAAMAAANPPKKSQAVLSLVLGIFSIIFAVIPPIGLILGWLSTRFSKKYRQRGGRAGSAYSGRIFGRVGFAFSFFMLILMAGCFIYIAGATFGNYGARSMGIYWNNSPLGQALFMFPFN